MEIDSPFAWTIAEAHRLAEQLASLRHAGSMATGTALWINDIRNRSPEPPEIEFPQGKHNFVKARFHNAFGSSCGRCLSSVELFGDRSTWCDGAVYVRTETDPFHLLYQFVRLDSVPDAFPHDALAALLSESDVVFRNAGSTSEWDKASQAYGFGHLYIGPFTHQKYHWWSFLTFISETQNLPIRYKPRCHHGWVYAGGQEWLFGGKPEEPFDWSPPVPAAQTRFFANDGKEIQLSDEPSDRQLTFGYVCHWFDALRASELACNWIAASLQKMQELQNLGAGFGHGNGAYGDVGTSAGAHEVSASENSVAETALANVANQRTDSPSEQSDLIVVDTERLFQAILRYCEARRGFWGAIDKPQQRSFFPPIFDAVYSLYEQLSKSETPEFDLMQMGSGNDLFTRGIGIVRQHMQWLMFQYPTGLHCIVATVIPSSYSDDGPIVAPDFRFFLLPLRMALGMMGSKLGDIPKESWWEGPCEPTMENPIPAILHRIDESLRSNANDDAGDSTIGEPEIDHELVTLANVAAFVHLDPGSLTDRRKDWPMPEIEKSGRRPAKWRKSAILPVLKKQFPALRWEDF